MLEKGSKQVARPNVLAKDMLTETGCTARSLDIGNPNVQSWIRSWRSAAPQAFLRQKGTAREPAAKGGFQNGDGNGGKGAFSMDFSFLDQPPQGQPAFALGALSQASWGSPSTGVSTGWAQPAMQQGWGAPAASSWGGPAAATFGGVLRILERNDPRDGPLVEIYGARGP